jgi:hypothetical protein
MPARVRRERLRSSAAAAGLLLIACVWPSTAAKASTRPSYAKAARTANVTDTAKLHYIRTSHAGSRALLLEEGTAKGALPGKMRATCGIETTFTASFTLYLHGGTIVGHGTATPHGSGTYESFAGKLTVTGGTGQYNHAHGHANLYGTFNRQTYALVVQTTGTLAY